MDKFDKVVKVFEGLDLDDFVDGLEGFDFM